MLILVPFILRIYNYCTRWSKIRRTGIELASYHVLQSYFPLFYIGCPVFVFDLFTFSILDALCLSLTCLPFASIRTHPLCFGGIRVIHIYSFVWWVFSFVCHRSLSCINVFCVSGLSILGCPFGFHFSCKIKWRYQD
jgi:hypothetical protein